jgi:6-pyruvoyltetrahydropterin/6-carboxytetrahydropterin synthase
MGQFFVSKKFKFDAAHKLEDHPGKCKNLHGHTWEVELILTQSRGPLPDNNIVMDFGDIQNNIINVILNLVDHQYLNDVFVERNPTAEFLAQKFWNIAANLLSKESNCYMWRVRVWESEKSYAEYCF